MKMNALKNWKTTLTGIVVGIAAAVKFFWPEYTSLVVTIMGVATSAGLIASADANRPEPRPTETGMPQSVDGGEGDADP